MGTLCQGKTGLLDLLELPCCLPTAFSSAACAQVVTRATDTVNADIQRQQEAAQRVTDEIDAAQADREALQEEVSCLPLAFQQVQGKPWWSEAIDHNLANLCLLSTLEGTLHARSRSHAAAELARCSQRI